MKNFKRILAIVLVVMMVVPMMTTGLSAATAADTAIASNTGVEIAGGNWKAFVYNDWYDNYAVEGFDNLGMASVSAEGQLVLYAHMQNTAFGLGAYGFTCGNLRNALQSTNTTEIDGLYFRNGMMATQGAKVVYGETMSFAFSETQLQGALDKNTYTLDAGFGVEGGMVADGLVITLSGGDASTSQDAVYTTISAYVFDGGKVVSSQSFETAPQNGQDFGLCVGHSMNTFFSLVDGVVTFHVEDMYSADGAYINQTYTFDELDASSLKTDKSYYFTVGAGSQGDTTGATVDLDGSVNINLARISDFVIGEDGTYDVTDSENKNVADWTGNGVATCEHVWGEYVEVNAATCTDAGLLEAACQNGCGATDTKTVPALGHSWSDWANTVEPTCTDAGIKVRNCPVCGAEETQASAALGHAWGDWYETVAPDCENDGLEQRDCATCGAYEEAWIDALGHVWVWDTLATFDTNGARHCDACGSVETDLAYDLTYYWTPASNNKVSNVDPDFADYNDAFSWSYDPESGAVEIDDMANVYGGDYNYNTMLKLTSEHATEISGFYATVENITEGYEGTALEGQYPTVLSFMWTTEKENYDGADEFSTYKIALSGTAESSRYGHLWDNYIAGKEYSVNIVLSDGCLFWGNTWYGELDDGEYDWIYYAVISEGNFWNLKMVQPTPAINPFEPITVSVFQEMDFASGKLGLFGDVNGFLFDFGELAGSQTADKNYYFSVAAYGDGANAATASFVLTDVCGQQPALFAGYEHECYDVDPDTVEVAPSCFEDGAHLCAVCQAVLETVPAIGEHSWVDADCITPKTCSVCGATEGEALGHNFVDFVCTVCGANEGVATVNGVAYETLDAAIAAANDGDTIKLLAGVSGETTYTFTKNVNLDLNGKTLRHKKGNTVVVDGATVTLVGEKGTIRSSDGISVTVVNGGSFVMDVPATIRCSSEEDFNVFAIDATSSVVINALGGRFYKDPTAAGATLAAGLAIEGSGTNWTVVEGVVEECAHEWGDWVVTVEPQVGVAGVETATCTLCGETKTQEIPALEAPVEPEEKAWTITFDPDGGVMPEGALLVLPINTNENYKEAAGYDYPVPTLEGYVFAGWYWEAYNYTLYKGDWDTGYYAVSMSIEVVALYEECAHANWSEWTVTVEPTYTAEGVQERTCLDCGYVETAAVEMLKKDYTITFDPDGGVMPEGALLVLPINYMDNYKEAAGYDYPVPTLEGGYVFAGWYWEAYNYTLTKGDWDGGYYAVQMSIDVVALYEECAHTNMSDWTVTVEPQVGVAGEQTATCLDCGFVVVEEIPALDPPAKAFTITFDPDGGVMPEGALLVLPIDYMDNYKEAAGYDYPVPTLDGYVFAGWYWELYNYVLDEGTWNGGYYAVQMSIDVIALWEEAPEVSATAVDNIITVTNIDDSVKDVWVAAGAQDTYVDVKANKLYMIPGNSAKVVDGAWSYAVAENGTYTVYVRYMDGTVEAKVFVVECNDGSVPNFVQDGATVTFNNLSDLYVLRYVAGEYDTAYAIKRAPGVVNIQGTSKRIVNGSYTVTLEPGTYSFVTQFNDGNYVYYTVVVEAPVPTYPERAYTITFDPDGGVMPAGTVTVLPIDNGQNYKEAAGYDYPVPTLEGYTFGGWYWEEYNFTLTEGDWNGGNYAITWSIDVVALWEEA